MQELIVIAGPANTGKMPLARKLLMERPGLVMVHRDPMRSMLTNELSEARLTMAMVALVRFYLREGLSVLQVSQNQLREDKTRWQMCAVEAGVSLWWLNTESPVVQQMIPPLETAHG